MYYNDLVGAVMWVSGVNALVNALVNAVENAIMNALVKACPRNRICVFANVNEALVSELGN